MNRVNWWAILAIAAILGGILAALVGASVQVMLVILTVSIVSAIFSSRV